MKKLLLFLAAGSVSFVGQAQLNSSIMLNPAAKTVKGAQVLSSEQMNKMVATSPIKTSGSRSARTTSSTYSDWYDLFDQNANSNSVSYYFPVFPDTNVYDPSQVTSTYNGSLYTHGLGMSFDPTDSGYYSAATSVNGGILTTSVSQPLPPTNGRYYLANPTYSVDSFFAPVTYIRHDATSNDSLIIEFLLAMNTSSDSGAYNLIFQASAANAAITYDSTPRFGTVHYNNGIDAPYNVSPYINDCYFDSILVPRQRYAFALNATTAADTDVNGNLVLGSLPANVLSGNTTLSYSPTGTEALALASPITVNASTGLNPHVVTFITFKSGHTGGTYPLHTPVTSANYIKLYAGDPINASAWFMQSASNKNISYAGSFQAGLMAFNQERYSDVAFEFNNHNILGPSSAFSTPDFVVTEQQFHISWNPTAATGVGTKTILNNVVAYPNPANNQLTISFNADQNTTASVSIVNMLGQVIATQTATNGNAVFNTASLPAGIYIYTVQANGEKTTSRVVIAH